MRHIIFLLLASYALSYEPLWISLVPDKPIINKTPETVYNKNSYYFSPRTTNFPSPAVTVSPHSLPMTVTTNRINGINNFVEGKYNVMTGVSNIVRGNHNNLRGGVNKISGLRNEIKGLSNNINGHTNYVSGLKNKVEGLNNQINGNMNSINGQKNDVYGAKNSVYGSGNKVEGSGNIVGHVNDPDIKNILNSMNSIFATRFSGRFWNSVQPTKYSYGQPFRTRYIRTNN